MSWDGPPISLIFGLLLISIGIYSRFEIQVKVEDNEDNK